MGTVQTCFAAIASAMLLAAPAPALEGPDEPRDQRLPAPPAARAAYEQAVMAMRRQPRRALRHISEAMPHCASAYVAGPPKVYAARTPAETAYYLRRARSDGVEAVVVEPLCAELLYLKGFIHAGARDWAMAATYLRMALNMAPANAQYLNELGHVHTQQGQWAEALAQHREAARVAPSLAPERARVAFHDRALRGMAYALVELGRLGEAEQVLHESLALRPGNRWALQELEYIRRVRAARR